MDYNLNKLNSALKKVLAPPTENGCGKSLLVVKRKLYMIFELENFPRQ